MKNKRALELDILVSAKTLPVESIAAAYKKEEVLGYCSNCSNFGNNFSCPSVDNDPSHIIKDYNYVTVIISEVPTKEISQRLSEFEGQHYPSQVYTSYMKKYPNIEYNFGSELSMYVFNHVKDAITDALLIAESTWQDTYGAPPGSCTKCETCAKADQQPCVDPDTVRYSLEAIGYKVSDIYKEAFDMELNFAREGLPEYFTSCSALFSNEPIDEQLIKALMKKNLNKIVI